MDGERIIEAARAEGATYADLRFVQGRQERLVTQDGDVETYEARTGDTLAIRVLVGGAWGMASLQNPTEQTALASMRDALRIAKRSGGNARADMEDATSTKATEIWAPRQDALDVDVQDRLQLLKDMEDVAKEDSRIKSFMGSIGASSLRTLYWNSDGSQLEHGLSRTTIAGYLTAAEGGQLASTSGRLGGTVGWELAKDQDPLEEIRHARDAAVQQLGARAPKGGKQTVVIDYELAGVFAHEAVGHASEADLVAAGESCFKGRLGEQLGFEELAIRDDNSIPGAYGSFPYDDDGLKARNKWLLKEGRLVGLLSDRERAKELGIQSTGSSRSQDAKHSPLVRMSNTMIEPGSFAEDEVLDVKDGIYCKGSRGGQVDTARGTFLFNAAEAYRIENGQIVEPLRDVSLSGTILGTLHQIDALGNKQVLGDPGHCGKGQWVPVCDGGPLTRIQGLLVGGQ